MPIKVSIIEDHKPFRESLIYIFSSTEGFVLGNAFSSIEEAMESMEYCDLILLDINLPGLSGIEGIPLLKNKFPEVKILILTIFEDDDNIFKAILNGADGYILKKTPPLRLIQAIEDAVMGGSPMSPVIAKKTLDLFKKYAPVKEEEDFGLTDRENEILSCLVNGLNNDDISDKLFISIQTVRNHIKHIYEKLHVHSKSQAVIKAIRQGIF
ncbi:MAG: response regulator transcription factor [Bacteroidota bacterium]|nr:response regulator transcription factor [Bacteroidota bacterium]